MLEKSPAAERIRAAIKATGKSNKAIAADLGISPQAVTGWLKTGRISKESAVALAQLAGMPVEELLIGAQGVRDNSARYALTDTPESQAGQASQSVRLDPGTVAAATRVLQIVFGRRGETVNLADMDFAELFAAAYEALVEMKDEPNAELLLTAQVIDLIAAREARRGRESQSTGGTDRAATRKASAR